MSKDTNGKKRGISLTEGHIVVKNRKIKMSDVVVFCLCLVISLAIWIYATGVERMEESKQIDQIQQGIQNVQQESN